MSKHLVQMTEEEREECVGMWVKTPKGYGILVDHMSLRGYYEAVVIVPSRFAVFDGAWHWDQLELLPHMPRAWEADGKPPTVISTTVGNRKLLSAVHGETYPYEWAVYQGVVPLERFIDKDEALDYFTKLVEEKCAPF